MKTLPGTLALALLLAGCGSTPLEQHEYLLRPQKLEVVSGGGRSAVLLKPVQVAPYLDQSGVVLQTGPAEIRAAKQHRWAEPLDEALGRYLQVGIANAADRSVETVPITSTGDRQKIVISVHQLHGSEDGSVRLVADYVVENGAGERRLGSFDERIRQASDGYPALVAAHGSLLDQLSAEIAAALETQDD